LERLIHRGNFRRVRAIFDHMHSHEVNTEITIFVIRENNKELNRIRPSNI
jgi:hypothetical protein